MSSSTPPDPEEYPELSLLDTIGTRLLVKEVHRRCPRSVIVFQWPRSPEENRDIGVSTGDYTMGGLSQAIGLCEVAETLFKNILLQRMREQPPSLGEGDFGDDEED